MDLTIISYGSEREEITEDVIKQINRSADCELEWKIEHIGDTIFSSTNCYRNVSKVEKTLDILLKQYQILDIKASYSYSIREEDGSADWWESVDISTETQSDGSRHLKKNCSTYWH